VALAGNLRRAALASIAIRRASDTAPLTLLALGAATGAATLYIGAANGFDSVNPNDAHWFALAGAIAGAVSGLIFGLTLRHAELKVQRE
jgi:membrane associated rhomboid family serine protease